MKSNGMHLNFRAMAMIVSFIVMAITPVIAAENHVPSLDGAWFKPELIENNADICLVLLKDVQAAFVTGENYVSRLRKSGELLVDDRVNRLNDEIVQIENKNLYVRLIALRGCGGACEGNQIISSVTPIDSSKRYANDFGDQELNGMPKSTAYGSTFFIKAANHNYYSISIDQTIEVNQLKSDALWSKSCEIRIAPSEQEYKLSVAATSARNEVKKLKEALAPIMGRYGNCGSGAFGYLRQNLLNELLDTITYRPWSVTSQGGASEAVFSYLEKWASQGVHQYNSYQHFNFALAQMSEVLKNFYMAQYGWSVAQAQQVAKSSLENSISRSFMPAYPPQSEQRKKIINVILEKNDISIIKSIGADLKLLDDVNSDGFIQDTLVATSINYSEALQYFLEQGLSPDTPNMFGKTPLMYAAQYNQLESVKLLLDAGANINAETIIPVDDCNFTLSKYGMTALHYAVRYSSKELIELLLERGANPYAKTSENSGGRPVDWLKQYTLNAKDEVNPYLSQGDVEQLIKRLEMPSAEEIQKMTKKLNLEAEQQFQEDKKEAAYLTIKKALNVDPLNDRALANFAFIAVRTGRIMEGLEASQVVIGNSKDSNQKANALFNYALACEDGNIQNERYNGKTYCNKYPLHYLLESYKLKPSEGKMKRMIQTFKNKKTPSCNFASDVYMVSNISYYGSGKLLYILHLKNAVIDQTSISWLKNKKNYQPGKLKESYDLGDYWLKIYESPETIYTPITYGNQICTSNSFDKYTVSSL